MQFRTHYKYRQLRLFLYQKGSDQMSITQVKPVDQIVEDFIKIYNSIESKIKKDESYSEPSASAMSYVKGTLKDEPNMTEAEEFIEKIVAEFKNWSSKGFDAFYVPQELQKMFEYNLKVLISHTKRSIELGCDAGIIRPLGAAFIYYYFLYDNGEIILEFDRDKWENSGDYCSKNKIAFIMNPNNPKGKIIKRKCDPDEM